MSYSLYKVDWRIMMPGLGVETKVSYHESEADYLKFFMKERSKIPQARVSTARKWLEHAPGNLRDQVHKAKQVGILGVWEEARSKTLAPLN
jgi:hypothetical protein